MMINQIFLYWSIVPLRVPNIIRFMKLLIRIVYHPFVNYLIRNVLFPFRNWIPKSMKIPISGVFRIPLAQGNQVKIATNQTNSMSKLVFWGDRENHEYTPIFLELIQQMDVFIDIGASIGYYSMLAAGQNPNIRIFSFEPSDGPFHYLQRNAKLNQPNQIQTFKLAISDQAGELSFFAPFNPKYSYLPHHLGGTGSLSEDANHPGMKTIKVNTQSLDVWLEEQAIDRIDLIKIDTEATEDRVLAGAMESIRKHQPIIITEVLFGKIEVPMDAAVKELGYEIFRHDQEGLHQQASLIRSEDDGGRNYFLVPPAKRSLIARFIVG